ncbi:type IV CRISPR-associated protein Csf3 [Geoalkalibacter subterraneus]|uniref:CRISPR-associated protein Csm4 n=1 Tax=Geoalkalibacter subterraneus TaxID=483547 RepID=A0A0B5FUA2_9BACT|nr:type IV CRISPR-associated protein Csf3 [Geoalkalibacter subterraneus]AJF08229.1 hypothetical protein GSUB_17235 [Geoalkalibacter subterraneus]
MDALKISWELKTPIVLKGDMPLMLDSLLAWCAVQKDHRENGIGESPWAAQERLPLGQVSGIWQASQLHFEFISERLPFTMTRRHELDPFAKVLQPGAKGFEKGIPEDLLRKSWLCQQKKDTFEASSGPYRAFLLHQKYRWVEKAQAWCVGDKDSVEELLQELTHLGSLTRNGFGAVKSTTVELASEDQKENWRIRPLPVEAGLEKPGITYAMAMQSVRPPYWDRTQYQKVLVPILPF